MTLDLNVVVTAVGGDLGQAIVKALRLADRPIRCHGTDIDPASPGQVFVDSFQALPPASKGDDYVRALDAACRRVRANVVIPASEPEIRALAPLVRLPSGARVVSQPAAWNEVYGDKLSCMRALDGRLPLAPYADGARPEEVATLKRNAGFPLVVKPRRSSGGRGTQEVRDPAELERALREVPSPMVQAYLPPDGGEFTIGVFRCDAFEEAICFRRHLGPGGSSWQAETTREPAVRSYALDVARAANAQGSLNVQVRNPPQGPRLLEINPRFSSLVAARALAGFRDVEWSLSLALDEPITPPRTPFKELRFRRYLHEAVDLGQGFGAVSAWAPRGLPNQ